MQRIILTTVFLMLLVNPALATGMTPSANLLPPGYTPSAQPSPAMPATTDDAERSGMGEAELAPTEMTMESMAMAPASMGQAAPDYIDVPPLAPIQQMGAPQATANPAYYTQGITTGPKAYNEGNFTFKR